MLQSTTNVLDEIELLRIQLVALGEKFNFDFSIAELLRKSQELDQMITQYHRLQK